MHISPKDVSKSTAMLSMASSALRRAAMAPRLLAPRALARGYHEKVIDHYESPRNVGSLDKKACVLIQRGIVIVL